MSPSPFNHDEPPVYPARPNHQAHEGAREKAQYKTQRCHDWIGTTLEVRSDSPSHDPAMSLQRPPEARAVHDWHWHPAGSEKIVFLAPSMSPPEDDSMEYGWPQQNDHNSGMKKDLLGLINVMVLIPFISIGIALYTILVIIATILILPLRLCMPTRPTWSFQLNSLLLPALNLHYWSACSSRRSYPTTSIINSWPGTATPPLSPASQTFDHTNTTRLSIPRLLTTMFLSPLLALPMSVAAFVIAIFWMFSALTTDETGVDESGGPSKPILDDGRWFARRLRRRWVSWLSGEVCDGRGRGKRRRSGARVVRIV